MKVFWSCMGWVLAICIMVVASGCCPMLSDHPLSTVADSDLPLIGVWQFESPEDDDIVLHVYKIRPGHFMMHYVEHKGDGRIDTFSVPIHLTSVGDNVFANVDVGKATSGRFGSQSGFFFIRIASLGNDVLNVTALAQDSIKAAIAKKEVAGHIQKRKRKDNPQPDGPVCYLPEMDVECIRITDTPERLRRFINDHPNGALDTGMLAFRRLK